MTIRLADIRKALWKEDSKELQMLTALELPSKVDWIEEAIMVKSIKALKLAIQYLPHTKKDDHLLTCFRQQWTHGAEELFSEGWKLDECAADRVVAQYTHHPGTLEFLMFWRFPVAQTTVRRMRHRGQFESAEICAKSGNVVD